MIRIFFKPGTTFPSLLSGTLLLFSCLFLAGRIYVNGLGMTYDSLQYLCAADSLILSKTLTMCDGQPFLLYAPGLPLLLAFFELISVPPLTGCAFFSPALFLLATWCWFQLLETELEEMLFRRLAQTLLVVSFCWYEPFTFLWSEAPFICLFSLAMLGFARNQKSGERKWLLLFSLTGAFSVLFRYAGVLLILPVFGYLFVQNKRKRVAVGVALLPLLLVMAGCILRMVLLTGDATGEREIMLQPVGSIIRSVLLVHAGWILPYRSLPWGEAIGSLFLPGFATMVLWYSPKASVWVVIGAFYLLAITFLAVLGQTEYDERLFVPVFPVFALVFFNTCYQLQVKSRQVVGITVCMVALIAMSFARMFFYYIE